MALTAESAARKDRTTANGNVEFQHRHFAAIADMLKNMHSVGGEKNRTWIADYFAGQLARTNSRFDRERFLTACNATDRI